MTSYTTLVLSILSPLLNTVCTLSKTAHAHTYCSSFENAIDNSQHPVDDTSSNDLGQGVAQSGSVGSNTHNITTCTVIHGFYVIDIAWDGVFYEIYRHEHEGEVPRASCHVYCIKHEDFSCYMCFISRRPRTYRVIIKIYIPLLRCCYVQYAA